MNPATSTGMDLLGGTSISGPLQSWVDIVIQFGTDFLAFIVIAALVAAYAFYFGRERLMTLIAGLYAAIPLYQAFPFFDMLPDTPYVKIGFYIAFALAGLIAFSGLSAFLARSSSSFLGTGVLSVLTAGLALAVAIHVVPIEEVYTFSGPTLALFSSDQAFFWWLLAPLAGLFFFGR
jgi:hypothetical protein